MGGEKGRKEKGTEIPPTEAEIMFGLLALSKEMGPQSTKIDEFLRGRRGAVRTGNVSSRRVRAWALAALMS